jgi:hypothetical protein
MLGLVCSCNKEDDFPVAEVQVPSFVGQKQDSENPDTRATDAAWTSGDAVGIYMLKNSDGYDLSKAAHKNKKYTVTNTTTGGLTPAAGHTMYFPVNGENVRFAAYYPYLAAADNANTLTFSFAGQSTKANKEAKDFAFHRATTLYSKSSSNVALSFKHKFCKIRITVKQGSSGPSCANLTATLTKMPTSATVDLAKLAVNEDDAGAITVGTTSATITPYITKSATEATLEAIVAPHTGSGNFTGRKFTFTADGKTYTYTLDNTFTFAAGNVYNFTYTLQPHSASVNLYDGLTNCYLVAPSGNVTIPITRAITVGGMSASATATLAILWKDADVISGTPTLTGSGASRTFKVTATSTQGNAVIALKGSDGTIYWSWHIWVSNYSNQTWTNNGYTFMDRNLGATAATNSLAGRGLLYHWGRKDPYPGGQAGTAGYAALTEFYGMPGAGESTATQALTETPTQMLETIRKPTTFLNLGFYANTDQIHLWNTSSNKKSVYDPCPATWRVPARKDGSLSADDDINSPWYGTEITFKRQGTNEDNCVIIDGAIYPMTGFRTLDDYGEYGRIVNNAAQINLWTASVNTYRQGLLMTALNSTYKLTQEWPRVRACSVRCVKE